ncbi:serine hydrolase domain-containing protein [Gracilimonas sp.]|uniref:serine hydrolase domain-containing protein n=1 Tax=Gracilimonas sp. TaxID=1974203 RepID=UPI0032F0963C
MSIHTKNRKRLLFLVVAGLTFVACSNREYQEVLESGIEQGYPGIIVGIQQGDNKPWIGSEGLASIEDQTPMRADDRFHIASVTKLFTSVAVLKLIDEGRLSLQSSVDTLLPNSLIGDIPFKK